MVHTGEQPFKCPDCEKSFELSYNLKRHRKVVHADERLFKCLNCVKSFARSETLDSHYNSIHNKKENPSFIPYECNSVHAMSNQNQITGSNI